MHLITRLVLDYIKARPGQFLYPDVMIQMNTKCPHTNIYTRGPDRNQCNYNRGARIQMVVTNNHWTLSRGWAGLGYRLGWYQLNWSEHGCLISVLTSWGSTVTTDNTLFIHIWLLHPIYSILILIAIHHTPQTDQISNSFDASSNTNENQLTLIANLFSPGF